ncbi:B-cell receptor CD22-like isoform X1 [Girardinichthys multiradiatus]|uniref:B-cell receptor CD22-like isoform X1 n=1 Tax=Girardinichthys multiradiatus TaxID=208333 RepID=UPI001FAD9748|nr:B-cell receptor CD22-like isoform X1 [Girardinichthys multiradiatus]
MGRWILIILGLIPGVWSGSWNVTYENQCAFKGTSVNVKCKYYYPFGRFLTWIGWSKVSDGGSLIPLSDLPSPPNHFTYTGNNGDCSLRVKNVQSSDQGAYYFRFSTTLGSWTSNKPALLSVKELTAVVQPYTAREGETVMLTCRSGCPEPTDIVWFKERQRVWTSVFQARREDAGSYYCAILGQETVRSASVALSVHYAPTDVKLSVSPSGDIVRGSMVTLTCSSEANPPVAQSGYHLYKDGEYVSSGQSHVTLDIQPRHRGQYHCQAWNNISWRGSDRINSSEINLDVQYYPMNVSVSVNPEHIVEGGRVNLTCSSEANPAADSYTWYKRTETIGSNTLIHVGPGQVLSLPSMESSHGGLYVCNVRNSLGEGNSTEVVLAVEASQQGTQSLSVLVGIGLFLVVMLIAALLLFRTKQKYEADKNQTKLDVRLNGRASNSEEPQDAVYSNIHILPSSPPPISNPYSPSASHRDLQKNTSRSSEVEMIYSTVTIKPSNRNAPNHAKFWSKGKEDDISVIYSSVVKSS